jgi:hypothetical protein
VFPVAQAREISRDERNGRVADKKRSDNDAVMNTITDETGQFDARFLLWRTFCAEHDVPVETLPSDLTGDIRDKWNELKDSKLK